MKAFSQLKPAFADVNYCFSLYLLKLQKEIYPTAKPTPYRVQLRPPLSIWHQHSASIFGIPKCPPRWERSSGLIDPETTTKLTSFGLRKKEGATLLIALFSKLTQISVAPGASPFS